MTPQELEDKHYTRYKWVSTGKRKQTGKWVIDFKNRKEGMRYKYISPDKTDEQIIET